VAELKRDIPYFLERLGKLQDSIPCRYPAKGKVRKLLNLLGKEVEGCGSGERTKAEDYDGLLS